MISCHAFKLGSHVTRLNNFDAIDSSDIVEDSSLASGSWVLNGERKSRVVIICKGHVAAKGPSFTQ